MLKIKSFLDHISLFCPNTPEKNDKKLLKYIQILKLKSITLSVISTENVKNQKYHICLTKH